MNTRAIRILFLSLALTGASLQAAEPGAVTPYLSGGIGEEELQQIEQAAREYNLKLLLTEKSGAYVAGVMLLISDSKGKPVLDLPAAGPLVLVRLAGGTYRISASHEGRKLEKTVNIRGKGQQTVHLAW